MKKNLKLYILMFLFPLIFITCVQEEYSTESRTKNKSSTNNDKLFGFEDPSCKSIALPAPSASLNLTDASFVNFTAEAEKFVGSAGVLQPQANFDSFRNFSPNKGANLFQNNSKAVTVEWAISGIPICEAQIRVAQSGQKLYKFGYEPLGNYDLDIDISDIQWPSEESTISFILSELTNSEALETDKSLELVLDRILSKKKCLALNKDSILTAYWEMRFSANNHVYKSIANSSEIFDGKNGTVLHSESFHASGTINARLNNNDIYTFAIKNIELPTLANSGYLCSSKLVTDQAFSADGSFNYNESQSEVELAQVTMFYNANIHTNWFKTLPTFTAWPGPQIRLFVDENNNGENTTAVYLPSGTGNIPTIKLGNGDGLQLKNLWWEPEVVSHEIGHHLVYSTLTETSGESVVLHEGLADFFVFARTNNSCLAETICPKNGTICASTKCLRSADNSLRFGENYNEPAHIRSQFLSGSLWDLGKIIGLENAANLAYYSINFYASDSGFKDFFHALMLADKDINNSANTCTIMEIANERGFADVLSDLDCENF